jgi:Ca-activated chloride channel homolog
MRTKLALCLFLPLLAAPCFGGDANRVAASGGPLLLDRDIRQQPQLPKPSDIRVDVDMALVPVTVLDPSGRNVLGLQPGNFKLFDGSNQMPIASFGRQDAPVSIGLIYDFSGSMGDKANEASDAPIELFQKLNATDEAFLITVSDHAELNYGFTSDFAELQNALLFANPKGTTPLLDGVYFGLSELKKAHNPRKVLVIVSDGGDNNSRYTLKQVLDTAVESDTQIFAIGLYTDPQSPEESDGPDMLNRLCSKTGGIAFSTASPEGLGATMAKLGDIIHNQYLLGYYPPENQQSGKYRKIKVKLALPAGSPRLNIYARSGYYVR